MKRWILPCSVLTLAALIIATGCTSPVPPQPVPETPVPTQASLTVTPTATPAGSTQPSPTDTLPAQWPLSFSIEKAGMYSTGIITHFDGGKGLSAVSRIDVRVTRADGSVITGMMKPLKGETLELEGTNGTDRVEVIVTMNNGGVYKIVDQQVPYKSRG